MVGRAPVVVAIAVVGGFALTGCGAERVEVPGPREAFLSVALKPPAVLPLPGHRRPASDVQPQRLLAYGDAACSWLSGQPIAQDPPSSSSRWADPFERENLTYAFAKASATYLPVALETPERSGVASLAWKYLCPDLSNRYNVVDVGDD